MKPELIKNLSQKILLVFALTGFLACTKNDSKIVGTWENVDKRITAIETFSANGHYTLTSPINPTTFTGEYTIKNNNLQIDFLNEKGKKMFDNKYKIIELTDDSMVLELQDGTKMSYRKRK